MNLKFVIDYGVVIFIYVICFDWVVDCFCVGLYLFFVGFCVGKWIDIEFVFNVFLECWLIDDFVYLLNVFLYVDEIIFIG